MFVLPAVYILGPALAVRELDGASSWAVIVACFGVGTVVGNVLAMRIPIGRPVLVAALALLVGGTQAVIITSGLGTAGIAALEVPAGVAVSLFFTLWDTSIQEQVAPAAVSRVSSYDFAASLGLMPLGMAVAGPLADGVGLQTTLVLMSGAGMLAALAWLAVPDVRRIRRGGPGDPPVVAAPVEPAPVATGRFEAEAGALVRDTDGLRFERDPAPVEER